MAYLLTVEHVDARVRVIEEDTYHDAFALVRRVRALQAQLRRAHWDGGGLVNRDSTAGMYFVADAPNPLFVANAEITAPRVVIRVQSVQGPFCADCDRHLTRREAERHDGVCGRCDADARRGQRSYGSILY